MGAFLPKNKPRRWFSINRINTSMMTTDTCELQIDTSSANAPYQRWVWAKCSRMKKPVPASAIMLIFCNPGVYFLTRVWA